jgi:hypothetical protein
MLSYISRKPISVINPVIREYYLNSTNNFIRNITKKYNEERKNKLNFIKKDIITNENLILVPNPNPNPNPNLLISLLFFSITATMYIYYKSKINMFSYNKYIDELTK